MLNVFLAVNNVRKILASPISATGWRVQTPSAVHGRKKVKNRMVFFWLLVTAL